MVAIKVIKESTFQSPITAQSIDTEISALKNLSHQYLCNLRETIQCDHHVFIIMEHCPGDTLANLLLSDRGGLPEHKAREILRQMLEGVAYIHSQGYAHRDLKPQNIMFTENQDVKIIDLGLSVKVNSIQSSERRHNNVGTPLYQAPELFNGTVLNAQTVDIWAIGVLLHIMLCDRLPFRFKVPRNAANIAEFESSVKTGQYKNPDNISQQASEVLRSMLTVDPQSRPTAEQLLAHTYFSRQSRRKQGGKHPRRQQQNQREW